MKNDDTAKLQRWSGARRPIISWGRSASMYIKALPTKASTTGHRAAAGQASAGRGITGLHAQLGFLDQSSARGVHLHFNLCYFHVTHFVGCLT